MAKKKKEYDLTETFFIVTGSTVSSSRLNPREWLHIIHDSLEACSGILKKAFRKSDKARMFGDYLNYRLEGSVDEKRIAPDKIVKSLPGFATGDHLFIEVETLDTREEKGQFFERKLFISVELAALIIVDVKFRKDPQEDQRGSNNPPKINENVVGCEIMIDHSNFGGDKEKFSEVMIPYFKDSDLNLGEHILNYILGPVVNELREMKEEVKKAEKELKPFLDIRRRLGIFNHLD